MRMRTRMRLVVTVALLGLQPVSLRAQGARAAARMSDIGSPLGFDPERLARIDRWVEGLIAEKQIPGAVVMLVRGGETAYHKAYGVRDLGTRAPMRTDDICLLYTSDAADE